jgi:hypothetical protein
MRGGGDRIAIIDGVSWLGTLSELTHGYQIQIFSASGGLASGNPPALPHAACGIGAPDGPVGSSDAGSDSLFDRLSFSPDGSSLAYDYHDLSRSPRELSSQDRADQVLEDYGQARAG